MKPFGILCILSTFGGIFLPLTTGAAPQANVRQKSSFNRDWKFVLRDDPAYRNPEYDDALWRALNVPHDWSIEGPYDPEAPSGGSGGYFPEGIGWYRKTFSLDDSLQYRQISIQFDGVYMNSEVWINGRFLGRYPYGYTTFQYDLTEHLEFGAASSNVLSVRANNSLPMSTRWYNGSGIYRNVSLIITNYTHFHNYHGVSITTPEVHQDKATVRVEDLKILPEERRRDVVSYPNYLSGKVLP